MQKPNVTILHHQYRQVGGEERCVRQLEQLLRDDRVAVNLLQRSSEDLTGAKTVVAAGALMAGGMTRALELGGFENGASGAERIVHAHNVHPTFGWRALRKLRDQGAAVVLHLHNYRLFCATGLAYRDGADCFDCARRSTWHGLQHNCRGNVAEAAPYALGLGLWQKRLLACVDVVVAPTQALLDDLKAHDVISEGVALPNWLPEAEIAQGSNAAHGTYGLIATRITPEKGVAVAIRAAAISKTKLVVAGEGPALESAKRLATELDADVEFKGQVDQPTLATLRSNAAYAIVPSTWQEVQPFAALESMAAGLPLLTSDTPALRELTTEDLTFPRNDHAALAKLMHDLTSNPQARAAAGDTAIAQINATHTEASALTNLRSIYTLATTRRSP